MLRLLFFHAFLYSVVSAYAQVSDPEFSHKAGFYPSSITVSIISPAGDKIYYSTDGSDPWITSNLYSSPVTIDSTTVLKARCFFNDTLFSAVKTKTYFINERSVLPYISLSTDPRNLWDPQTGIYTEQNCGYDWERPVHIEFFETDGDRKLDIEVGARIFGESSRMWPEKSLALFARSVYGPGKIKCRFFPDLDIDEFETIVLRNGGSDFNMSMFRDEFMQTSVRGINIDRSAYRPSVVFINGVYWGIHNIREKTDEHYLQSHYNANPDLIDLVLYWGIQPDHGNLDQFWDLNNFVDETNFSIQSNYDSLKNILDTDEFINYITTNIWFDNTDWPANNVKSWKERKPGARWRWILHDIDCGLDLRLRKSYLHNSLDYAMSAMGVDFPNSRIAMSYLNKLVQNTEFRNDLINRFADFSNTIFSKDTLLQLLSEFRESISPEIPRHFSRWQDTLARWDRHLTAIETFIINRQPVILQNYMSKFNLTGTSKIIADVNDPYAGYISFNSLKLRRFPWEGTYFVEVPVSITAIPCPGYVFKNWDGALNSSTPAITFHPKSLMSFSAIFEADPAIPRVLFNEINYNSSTDFDTEDWVELYNGEAYSMDISGWEFRDSNPGNLFTLPENTILQSHGYLVICRDTVKFLSLNKNIRNIVGNFSFALSNGGESILLFDKNKNFVDSLEFSDDAPWPIDADGQGHTLELKNPVFNNSNPLNWQSSKGIGTPGSANSNEEEEIIPRTFLMSQNYPNPFNDGTTIMFQMPVEGKVKIIIYNILGEKTAELLNTQRSAGYYQLNFGGEYLSSGIYFYSIEVNGLAGEYFIDTKKMVHLK